MQLKAPSDAEWPTGIPIAVTHQETRISLSWADGRTRPVNVAWLRDNCPCTTCRIAQTGEHRYFMGLVDEMPTATRVELTVTGALSIEWSDAHASLYTPDDFARITHVAARDHDPAQRWSDDYAPAAFDHRGVVEDLQTRAEFVAAVVRDGMALVTDTPCESGECIRFLETLGLPVRDTPFDRLHDVYVNTEGYNVAHTDEPLPPHNDFASYFWPPSGQLLHMLVNEVAGGEWVNVDGFRVLHRLQAEHPEAVDTLARVVVPFRQHSDTAESWTRATIVRRDSRGEIIGIRFSNQLMQPLDPCDPDLEDFYEAYHLLSRAVSDPSNQIELRGDAGTMQVLHGHRILHARRGFDASSGARHLQDTYFEFDDLRALHARMTGDAR